MNFFLLGAALVLAATNGALLVLYRALSLQVNIMLTKRVVPIEDRIGALERKFDAVSSLANYVSKPKWPPA